MKSEICVALGDFDGVHLGHRAVIDNTVNNKFGLTPAVYTFTDNCKGAPYINSSEEKTRILHRLGIKQVILGEFDEIRHLSPAEFVKDILIDKYNVKAIVCGNDYRFGKNAVGDVELLSKLCSDYGVHFTSVDILNITDVKVSSSDIRNYIASGDIEHANALLGRRHFISGTVTHGKRLGSANHVPTINIPLSKDRVTPAFGVYITETLIKDKAYASITNIGVRPSVETTDIPNAETNIFDFSDDIYDEEIVISFIRMLRKERKFDTKEQLFEQIGQDIIAAKTFFGEINE